MAKRLIVRVSADGTVTGLYHDILNDVGAARIHRVSHVEFDNAEQAWAVKWAVGDHSGGRMLPRLFRRREDALAAEVAFMNDVIKQGCI
jgi:hypothetical protein